MIEDQTFTDDGVGDQLWVARCRNQNAATGTKPPFVILAVNGGFPMEQTFAALKQSAAPSSRVRGESSLQLSLVKLLALKHQQPIVPRPSDMTWPQGAASYVAPASAAISIPYHCPVTVRIINIGLSSASG